MLLRPSLLLLAALPLAALTACSSASPPGPADSPPAAFAKYCTGTLLVDKRLMKGMGANAWRSDGSTAGAGTKFLVSPGYGQWEGFLILVDGAPAKLAVDYEKRLVKDTDFTSDCATDPAASHSSREVVLARSTIYPNKELTGTACVLEPGTEFTSYSFAGGFDVVAKVSSPEIKAQCGLDSGYTRDLLSAGLMEK